MNILVIGCVRPPVREIMGTANGRDMGILAALVVSTRPASSLIIAEDNEGRVAQLSKMKVLVY